MTIDDAARIHLFEQARSTWGAEAANTLINAMPSNSDSFATRDDIATLRGEAAAFRSEVHAEFADVRNEMRTEFAAVRNEMAAGFAAVDAEFAAVRAEMQVLRSDLSSEISKHTSELLRTLFFGMIASNATLVGLVLAAVKLG